MAELNTISALLNDANLQGYWRLEADGTDSGPNGYTLAPGNAPAGYVSAKYGNGADFEASATDYIGIANASCPNLEISGDQTWGCWYKPETTTASTYEVLMGKTNAATTVYRRFIKWGDDKIALSITTSNGTHTVSHSTVLSAGNWYFCVWRYDASEATIDIFVNNSKATFTSRGTSVSTSTGGFCLGREGFDANFNPLDGVLDDAFIFNRYLTDDEITTLYSDTSIKSVCGLAKASVKSAKGLAIASVKKINGLA